jgi:hypothetical protein
MSDIGLILPPGSMIPPTMQKVEPESIPLEERGKQLPVPSGFKVLCAVVEADETIEGTSLIKTAAYKQQEEVSSPVLFVMKLAQMHTRTRASSPPALIARKATSSSRVPTQVRASRFTVKNSGSSMTIWLTQPLKTPVAFHAFKE